MKIARVCRESNQVADFMSNLGVNMQPGLVVFDEAPTETMNLLLNDRLGQPIALCVQCRVDV